MKSKKTRLTVIASIAISFVTIAQVPSYLPSNGLVAYWPFNNNANDESGNGNNGVVNGGQLTTDRNGNSNAAYLFSTNTEYISGNGNSLNNQNFTVSLWLWIDGMSNTTMNCFKYGGTAQGSTDGGYRIYADLLGQKLGVQDADGINVFNTSSTNNSLQQWHHLVGTYNSNQLNLYLDGVLVSSNTFINSNIIFPQTIFYIGNSGNTNNSNLNSRKLDDIGIWNRALTQQEINNLYNSLGTNECLTMTINSGALSTNPVPYTSSVSIYPNPANDHITIDCGNIANVTNWSIKITNILGQEVFNQPMNTQQYIVPLNTWTGTGMYFVKIINAQNEVLNIKKIILQ